MVVTINFNYLNINELTTAINKLEQANNAALKNLAKLQRTRAPKTILEQKGGKKMHLMPFRGKNPVYTNNSARRKAMTVLSDARNAKQARINRVLSRKALSMPLGIDAARQILPPPAPMNAQPI